MRFGHFVKNCRSSHRCRVCQKPYHTLLHIEDKAVTHNYPLQTLFRMLFLQLIQLQPASHGINSNKLLITCRVLIEPRALLDSGSSVSFISEYLGRSYRIFVY
jgi:hypothetical protein